MVDVPIDASERGPKGTATAGDDAIHGSAAGSLSKGPLLAVFVAGLRREWLGEIVLTTLPISTLCIETGTQLRISPTLGAGGVAGASAAHGAVVHGAETVAGVADPVGAAGDAGGAFFCRSRERILVLVVGVIRAVLALWEISVGGPAVTSSTR